MIAPDWLTGLGLSPQRIVEIEQRYQVLVARKEHGKNLTLQEIELRRLREREYIKRRERESPAYKLRRRLHWRMWAAIIRQRGVKSRGTIELLGATIEQARKWIESQFKPGMSWENYGDWHIDHKIPCADFDLTKTEEQFTCFHFSNLRPLWALENLSRPKKGFRNIATA